MHRNPKSKRYQLPSHLRRNELVVRLRAIGIVGSPIRCRLRISFYQKSDLTCYKEKIVVYRAMGNYRLLYVEEQVSFKFRIDQYC